MAVVSFVILAGALALCALAAVFAVETVGAFRASRSAPTSRPDSIAVVIPAHNESGELRATVETVRAQVSLADRVIVIADNCTDDTAAQAAAAGAEVLERKDPERRGKGFALQFALDALRNDPPEVVYFIDADCVPEDGAIETVAGAAFASGRPAQGLTLMHAPEGAPPHRNVAEFAWLVMNRVRMSGLFDWFDVTRLTGTGMALPWTIAETIDLASGEIVEDLALSLALTRRGAPPVFVSDAVIHGEFPASEAAAARQRARWEHGSLNAAKRNALALLVDGVRRGDRRQVALAADLAIPPLVIFATLLAAMAGLSLIAAFAFGAVAPLVVSIAALVLFAGAVGAAWGWLGTTRFASQRGGRHHRLYVF